MYTIFYICHSVVLSAIVFLLKIAIKYRYKFKR